MQASGVRLSSADNIYKRLLLISSEADSGAIENCVIRTLVAMATYIFHTGVIMGKGEIDFFLS